MIPIPPQLAGWIAGKVIPWRLIGYIAAAAAISIACYASYRHVVNTGRAEVQAAWDKAELERKAAQAQADNAELRRALQVTEQLGNLFTNMKKDMDANEERIRNLHAATLDSLRNRPATRASAPSGLPDAPSTGVGCTGAGLARPDAVFLAGYAADAQRNADALKQCDVGYKAARDKLNSFAKPAE